MCGKEPRILVTGQDPAMKVPIQTVYDNVHHRFYMWHIMNKAAEKVGPKMARSSDFLSRLNCLVWSFEIEPNVFEDKWVALMEEFRLQNHNWFSLMFEIRESWISAYIRDVLLCWFAKTTSISECQNRFFGEYNNRSFSLFELIMHFDSAMYTQRFEHFRLNSESESKVPDIKTPLLLEKNASEVYTLMHFFVVLEEIYSACFHSRFVSRDLCEESEFYNVEDLGGHFFKVSFSILDKSFSCTCKLFQRIGVSCRHMILLFKDKRLDQIPSNLILDRWTKPGILKASIGVNGVLFDQCAGMLESKMLVNEIWSEVHSCVDLMVDDCVKLKEFLAVLKEHKSTLAQTSESESINYTSRKSKLVEFFVGTSIHSNIIVHPPQQGKNKGSRGHLKSGRDIAIESGSKKASRKCSVCNKYIDHNSRTCPEKPKE